VGAARDAAGEADQLKAGYGEIGYGEIGYGEIGYCETGYGGW
jgi:hypothetical protein